MAICPEWADSQPEKLRQERLQEQRQEHQLLVPVTIVPLPPELPSLLQPWLTLKQVNLTVSFSLQLHAASELLHQQVASFCFPLPIGHCLTYYRYSY